MPDTSPNSEQLHRVVELSSGIRDDHYVRSNVKMKQNPVDKLKEALSSKSAFQKYYLVRAERKEEKKKHFQCHNPLLFFLLLFQELSELSISTFKHIGRTRSARFIGIDLAKFYLLQGQVITSLHHYIIIPILKACGLLSACLLYTSPSPRD